MNVEPDAQAVFDAALERVNRDPLAHKQQQDVRSSPGQGESSSGAPVMGPSELSTTAQRVDQDGGPAKARGKFAKRAARQALRDKRLARGALAYLQSTGMTRYESRRQVFGGTRREASSHMTRGQHLADRVRVNAAARRDRRRAQVLAASFTGALVEGGL